MTTAALLRPLQLGPYTTRNRIFMSAMTRNRSVPTNVPNDLNVEYYRQRARSAGLIVSEGILVSQQGTEYPHAPGIWSQEQVNAWKKVTDAVHAEGGLIFAQLWHVGRVAHPEAPEQIASGEPVYAPSAIAARGGKFRHIPGKPDATYVTPTGIPNPKTLVDIFTKAAINAKEANFDGVEFHGAHGYVLTQFLESGANHRTDEWGGSVANRIRIVLEAIDEVSKIYGPERVGIKLSPAGGPNDVGMPLDEAIETYSTLITEIDKRGIAYITLMRYSEMMDNMYLIDGKPRGTPHDVISTYGPLVKNPKTAFIANVGYTPEEGAKLIEEGKASAISFGIPWIVHPDLAKMVEKGKPLEVFTKLDMRGLYGYFPPYPHREDQMKGENLAELKEELKKGYTDYPDSV
ncbi:hypothetical protein D9758_010590 [Tetrapyrgos nigripes]|uniref:NADH:flavin oxidoreductase/NADH oxidase N-terminal domain-containing protein n=1 Tax=Tetrapyrgos nigripes TaxID=182062 RepID=A0A8H5D597_9AGAR|nr:hypothetical protein D9758_010590 [Tetrapyrgos nigripes]